MTQATQHSTETNKGSHDYFMKDEALIADTSIPETKKKKEKNKGNLIDLNPRVKDTIRQNAELRMFLMDFICDNPEMRSDSYLMKYMYSHLFPFHGTETAIDGKTLLMAAVQRGYAGLVSMLISVGADLNATDRSGKKPIDYVDANKHPQLALYLAKKIASNS